MTDNKCKDNKPWTPDRHTTDIAYLSKGCVRCSNYCDDYHKYVSQPWYFRAAMQDGAQRRTELMKDLAVLLQDLLFILTEMPAVSAKAKRKKK